MMKFIKLCAALFLVIAFSGCAYNGMRADIDEWRAVNMAGGLNSDPKR